MRKKIDPASLQGRLSLSPAEAAALAGVSLSTLRQWLDNGTLPCTRLAGRQGTRGRILIARSDLDRVLSGESIEKTAVAAWTEMGRRARKALAILEQHHDVGRNACEKR